MPRRTTGPELYELIRTLKRGKVFRQMTCRGDTDRGQDSRLRRACFESMVRGISTAHVRVTG